MIGNCRLKIMHIASGDLWAGAEVQLYTLSKTLQYKASAIVSIVLLNHGRLEQELLAAGIEVIVLDESKLNGIRILHRLTGVIREQGPDIVHTHRLKENILGSLAALLAGNRPTIRTVHGAPEHRPPWWRVPKHILFTLDRIVARLLQKRIISVSVELKKRLQGQFPPSKIRVIENGIDLDTVQRQSRKEWSFPDSGEKQFIVGFAGRLVPVKRVDLMLRAAAYLRINHPQIGICFLVYGDGPLRASLEKLNSELGTTDRVHFRGPSDDIAERIREMNALIVTSDHEGLPMVVLEAMALQVPVIAHAAGGLPELLDNGVCGILVHEHNPAGYANAILDLTSNPDKQTQLAAAGLERVRERYSAERNAEAYYKEYVDLVTIHRQR
jgi:glycosyltransferase involved in cell wall biosynthesis